MEDLSVSILIDNKNNVSNPIKIPKRKTSIWIPDHKVNCCFSCNERFNIIKRKHHCRLCGRIYCHSCTTYITNINELLISTTPPSDVFSSNYLYDKLGMNWWSADVRICKDCEKDAKIIDKSELYIILFSIIQVKITDLMKLRLVCKEWCSSINHILSAFRSIQYKLSNQKFSRLEKNINVYSFSLRPEDHQPRGTCNFSRIDTARLITGASLSSSDKIYAVNYNVLRIMSGMGGLAYSN